MRRAFIALLLGIVPLCAQAIPGKGTAAPQTVTVH